MRRFRLQSIESGAQLVMGAGLVCIAVSIYGNLDPGWLVIEIVGGGLACYGLARLRRIENARLWKRVPAIVLSRGVVEVWNAGYPRFRPFIEIETFIAGKIVRSRRFSIDEKDYEGERDAVEMALSPFSAGKRIYAFVDPGRVALPVVCIEVPEVRRGHYRTCVLAGGVLTGVALVVGGLLAH